MLSISSGPLKFTVMIKHLFVLGLGLCVCMYTVSWDVEKWERCWRHLWVFNPVIAKTHQERLCRVSVPGQDLSSTWSLDGVRGLLAINYRKPTRSAGKPSQWDPGTSDTRQDECFSVTQQHDLPQDSLHTSTFKYAFQIAAHPSSSAPTPSPSLYLNHILRMLHYFRGYFLTNAKWLCSSMIKVDIFLF